jgi:predicted dehydrogenase
MGHERRFEPPIVDILQKASGGHLGRILQIEANFSHDKFMTLNKSNWRLDPRRLQSRG